MDEPKATTVPVTIAIPLSVAHHILSWLQANEYPLVMKITYESAKIDVVVMPFTLVYFLLCLLHYGFLPTMQESLQLLPSL